MVKVITYGTYDLLHYGHIRLLERAKALGDYLIVGITADDFDKTRGKINVQQPLMERIEAVRETGLANEIIVEEYEGQKIDDIQRLGIDIFTVGSDWKGKFDYLNDYCKVVYLDRTEGISSSEIRSETRNLSIGLVGESTSITKFAKECDFVNGISVSGIFSMDHTRLPVELTNRYKMLADYEDTLKISDAVYIASHPSKHFDQIKKAIENGKHVICEAPIATTPEDFEILFKLAKEHEVVLTEAIKTAYATAYSRLLLLIKSGKIGDVVSVDATCTSQKGTDITDAKALEITWNGMCEWGPIAMLPVFQLLGTEYSEKHIVSHVIEQKKTFDLFSKIDFVYPHAVASIKIGEGAKSEGELVVSGTKGYAYVPAPWWKPDYFEIRYENPADNRRYFYQLEGEGIRYEIVAFVKAIQNRRMISLINKKISRTISSVIADFEAGKTVTYI